LSNNIVGLISGVSDKVATQISKNCRRRQPHCHLMLPPRGTPANIRMQLIFPDTIGLHFCRCMYGSIFIQICAVGSNTRIFSVTECVLAVQGHPRSMILVWYQLKARMQLPICLPLRIWSYLAPFLRYGDLLAKNWLYLLFLPRVSIAYYAECCTSYSKSVRPSVRLSHAGTVSK